MAGSEVIEKIMAVFDDPDYARLAVDNALLYKVRYPTPHASFDDFLPAGIVHRIAGAFPSKSAEGWTVHSNAHADRKFLGDETKANPLFRAFMQATSSRQFLLFLETLTGIQGLIPDPYYIGGGAMTAGRGDKLDMHLDFNWHYKLHAHRRCNALFYLTPDWNPEWDGRLVLGKEQSARYLPHFNRCIVFTTSEESWHGQPDPIICPPGELRRVFSAFYYTAASPEQEADPHLTKYHDTTPYTEKPLKEYQELK
jgi:2OG-Fe(II) oxygenase superfamily